MDRQPVICRACHVQCALLAEMEDGRPAKLYGDKDNPVYHGYSCIKGRRLGAYHALPSRLLQSQKKQADGSHMPIASDAAMREIAGKVRELIDRHGPRSVAGYIGTHGYNTLPTQAFAYAFFEAIGSPMMFTSVTIDQPGKGISLALHGPWLAGATPIEMWDVLLLVGTNPLVSMNGGLGVNPARQLHEAKKRGMKLIVIDPRVSDSAAKADIHLQAKPGEDGAVLAGIARILIAENLIDADFVAAEADGLEALRQAVAPFTPQMVEARAGVKAEDLIAAARMFGTAARGAVSAGTGRQYERARQPRRIFRQGADDTARLLDATRRRNSQSRCAHQPLSGAGGQPRTDARLRLWREAARARPVGDGIRPADGRAGRRNPDGGRRPGEGAVRVRR